MSNNNKTRKEYDETSHGAPIEFLQKTGGELESAPAELGLSATELQCGGEKLSPVPVEKNLSVIARLKAENEALRNEILQLQVQWDILKTTLGVLATTTETSIAA